MVYEFNPNNSTPIETGNKTIRMLVSGFYNCNTNTPCGDCDCITEKFYYVEGDTFDFQFNKTVVDIIAINCDGSQTNVSSMILANPKMIRIDTSNIAYELFRILVIFADTSECCLSFWFTPIPYECSQSSLLISSEYPVDTYDCNGNYYDGVYSNKIRIPAELLQDSIEITSQKDSEGNIIGSTQTKIALVGFTDFLNPEGWIYKHLASILAGKKVIVETEQEILYFQTFNGSLGQGRGYTDGFLPDIELRSFECESDFRCQ